MSRETIHLLIWSIIIGLAFALYRRDVVMGLMIGGGIMLGCLLGAWLKRFGESRQ